MFSCPVNPDVEQFLIKKSIRFEESDNARTYFVLNQCNGEILAYFSLSFKEISFAESGLSKSQIKKLDGISKDAKTVRTYLIGQIAKNFAIENNEINLNYLLKEIYTIISIAKDLIGGRTIILECENIDSLIKLYENHGFKRINIESPDELITMYSHIK